MSLSFILIFILSLVTIFEAVIIVLESEFYLRLRHLFVLRSLFYIGLIGLLFKYITSQ